MTHPRPRLPQQDFQPESTPPVEQPKSWEPEPLEDWGPPAAEPAELETAKHESAAPETFEHDTVEPEIAEPQESQPRHALESDDTEVLEELASVLQEITPLTGPSRRPLSR